MADIQFATVTKRFGSTTAVAEMDLRIADGAFVVLLGPTGAGKTTTLRLIAGLERPDSGTIHIGGHDVTEFSPAQRDIAMVFQQYSLYPHLSVRDNLAFPLRSPRSSLNAGQIDTRVRDVAEILQIASKLDNKATALSGGEMQRVSIGRALVREPTAYLMDEPLGSLDAKLRSALRVELKRIHDQLGATFLYVTHDQIEAMTMATEIGVLDAGRLVQIGSPRQIYTDPESLYVASRLGQPRINALPADVFANAPARAATIGLRPENIVLDTGRSCTVTRVEHLGDQTRLHVRLDDHEIITLADAHARHTVGDRVKIAPKNPLYFDASGRRIR